MPNGSVSNAGPAGGTPGTAHNGRMSDDEFAVMCPYCGESVEVYVEPDVTGSFVQDCEVCCNPWLIRVSGAGEDRSIDVGRADGSE